MPANLENSAVATGLEKSVFIPVPKKGNAKECSNYHTIALISHADKVMLKILQARLQQCVNQMFKLDLERAEKPEIKSATSVGSLKKQEFQKNIYFCFIDYAKAFDCVDHNKLWKILKDMGIPDHLTCLCMQVKKQQLELNMKQQIGSKSGKEYVKAEYCHRAYLTYMQSTS